MATYLILNCVIIVAVCLVLRITPRTPSKAWLVMLGALLLLTLVFDNLMIALDFFHYAPDKILGIYIGLAPIEDFMYALLAALLIPAIWITLGTPHDTDH